jgi:HD-like signal output (HDOD) protein/GGDEF domain-containing protein
MNQNLIEEILGCPSLPSLPAVAARVLELTDNPNVQLQSLASTIQNDQALAARILRTVNSSFYGLRTKCSTIKQALVMLGLSAVKSLALGFALADTLKPKGQRDFDYVSYWRRGLYTAVAAKAIARAARKPAIEDEAFLGGLLQDIGMMAMYQALGDRYLAVLAQAGRAHRTLSRYELEAFDVRHADIGAMLAQRWKLPDQLVMPVKYHERPTAAPTAHADLVRCVGLGTVAHDVLTDRDPLPALRSFYDQARQWFGLEAADVDQLLPRIAQGTFEVSELFQIDTGPQADAEELLRSAQQRMTLLARRPEQDQAPGMDALLIDGAKTDPLTGIASPTQYEPAVRAAFQTARSKNESLSLVEVVIGCAARDHASPPAGPAGDPRLTLLPAAALADDAVIQIVTLLKKHFGPLGAVFCRVRDDAFAAIIPGAGQIASVRAAAELRLDLQRAASAGAEAYRLTASIGAAALEPATAGVFARAEQLMAAATRAAAASREAGGDCVRAFVPRKAA